MLTKLVNGKRFELSESEIKEHEERIIAHQKEQEELKKVEYLKLRKLDPNMPSLEEKVDAILDKLLNDDNTGLSLIQSKIDVVNLKYPKP